MPSGDFIAVDAAQMRTLHRALRDVAPQEARALNKRLRSIAKPLETKVRNAALKLPADASTVRPKLKKGAKMGLRQGIAYAVETRVNSGRNGGNVRIRVSGSKFAKATGGPENGGYRKLPRYMEGLSRRPWRHPVFADKGATRGTWQGAWAEQKPKPYLLPTILPEKDAIRDALIHEYMDTFAKHLKDFGIPVR